MSSPAHISFRPVTERDLPTLHTWVTAPHVRRWWDAPTTTTHSRRRSPRY
jgi:hypothetical protein